MNLLTLNHRPVSMALANIALAYIATLGCLCLMPALNGHPSVNNGQMATCSFDSPW